MSMLLKRFTSSVDVISAHMHFSERMKLQFKRSIPQPLTAIIMGILASTLLAGPWFEPLIALHNLEMHAGLVAMFLAAGVICAGMNPIHIRRNLKIFLTTVPMYVAALILPPIIAASTIGVSTLVLQLLIRAERGNTPSDIATATARSIIIVFLSAWVARQTTSLHTPLFLVLLSVALVMFTCDMVTGAFEIAPMSGETPWHMLVTLMREASLAEGAQYLLGILAALAAFQQVWSLVLWILPISIVRQAFKNAKEMHEGTSMLLESMADAVDLRDPYTGGHSRRVTEYSMHILRDLGVSGPEMELIRSAARVHDIGKIGIPDQILNKPGWLTPEEKSLMDAHPVYGAELLARYQDFARGIEIVRHHHERWDGGGYPTGLKGLDIPFGARVVAVADSFDAMTSDRPYRAGMPIAKAAKILREGRGEQWDVTIVDAFLHYLEVTYPDAESALNVAAAPTLLVTT